MNDPGAKQVNKPMEAYQLLDLMVKELKNFVFGSQELLRIIKLDDNCPSLRFTVPITIKLYSFNYGHFVNSSYKFEVGNLSLNHSKGTTLIVPPYLVKLRNIIYLVLRNNLGDTETIEEIYTCFSLMNTIWKMGYEFSVNVDEFNNM